jgi:hypothetical protein
MALKKEKFNKYLYIQDNVVYTKEPARIFLDLNEYKNINEDVELAFDEEQLNAGIEEIGNVYEIPGFFTLEFPEQNDSIQFYFPYNIFIFQTENSEVTSKSIEINYDSDSPVFYAKFKKEATDIRILDKLFENGVKYLSDNIPFLVLNIWKQFKPTMNLPLHNIELILSQLYGVKVNGKWVPVRLTPEQKYCKECALNTKQSAHYFNKTLGFLYGYSNDALLTAITNPSVLDKESSYLEKMIEGEF